MNDILSRIESITRNNFKTGKFGPDIPEKKEPKVEPENNERAEGLWPNRPNKMVTITDISGRELTVNIRDFTRIEVMVNGVNSYYIFVSGEKIQLNSTEFHRFQQIANGYKYLISKR